MRIVFDTNVLVSGILAEGLCREIVETHLPDHTPILSSQLWDELVEAAGGEVRSQPRRPAAARALPPARDLG